MSSHHIVRDEQEPALYIYRADNFLLAALGDLLEWSPTVIVSDEALKKVADFGIKVDAVPQFPVTKDFSSILDSQQPIRSLPFDADDIFGLFRWLETENYKGLNMATTQSGCEELLTMADTYEGALSCTIYTASRRMIRIRQAVFEKWLPEGKYAVRSTGALSLLVGLVEETASDVAGELELTKSEAGLVRISCQEPPFWFVENM